MSTDLAVFAAAMLMPVVAAPLVAMALQPLFTFFLTEGGELFAGISLRRAERYMAGLITARLNVLVLLLAWLALVTCHRFSQPMALLAGIALAAVLGSILLTSAVVRSELELRGAKLWLVSLTTFAGGNVPAFLLMGGLLAVAG